MNKILFLSVLLLGHSLLAGESRIKDLTRMKGVRSNRLTGYGLVVGLQGTGDSPASLLGQKTMSRFLNRIGVKSELQDVVPGSYSVVVVTAELTPFARIGDRLQVHVSTQGDTTSLAGGTLLSTPLVAADGQTYAIAHGQLSVGQADGVGAKVLTVATLPEGGVVEKEHIPKYIGKNRIVLSLKTPDFSTNHNMVKAINLYFKGFYAESLDVRAVEVQIPKNYREDPIRFLALLENIPVSVDAQAVVVISERTGTVVMGHNVKIDPVVISHGDLSLKIAEASAKVGSIQGNNVGTLIEGLNAFGAGSSDLVSILQAIKAAGALRGEIKFI